MVRRDIYPTRRRKQTCRVYWEELEKEWQSLPARNTADDQGQDEEMTTIANIESSSAALPEPDPNHAAIINLVS